VIVRSINLYLVFIRPFDKKTGHIMETHAAAGGRHPEHLSAQ